MTPTPEPLSPTPLGLHLQRHLAEMLPEVIHVYSDGLFWLNTDSVVRTTEYAHLVSLAEAKLTEEQWCDYWDALEDVTGAAKQNSWGKHYTDERLFICATPVQRLTALCRVLGKEVA